MSSPIREALAGNHRPAPATSTRHVWRSPMSSSFREIYHSLEQKASRETTQGIANLYFAEWGGSQFRNKLREAVLCETFLTCEHWNRT
eukprot:2742353-Amphidinium_carterae.1